MTTGHVLNNEASSPAFLLLLSLTIVLCFHEKVTGSRRIRPLLT
jgi:hypothetical protein